MKNSKPTGHPAGLRRNSLEKKYSSPELPFPNGRRVGGLPNLGSLQQLASLFGISVDELLGSNELVALAQTEVKNTVRQSHILMFGLLDVLCVLLVFLPIFADGKGHSFTLYAFYPIALFLQPLMMALVILPSAFGVVELALQSRLSVVWGSRI